MTDKTSATVTGDEHASESAGSFHADVSPRGIDGAIRDYFGRLYDWAVQLVRDGKAYVCDLTGDDVAKYRGGLEGGTESPYPTRPVAASLDLLARNIIRPAIFAVMPLAQIARAHELMERSQIRGRIAAAGHQRRWPSRVSHRDCRTEAVRGTQPTLSLPNVTLLEQCHRTGS